VRVGAPGTELLTPGYNRVGSGAIPCRAAVLGCCAVAATPAVRILERAGVPFTLHEYDPATAGPGAHGYGAAAVDALGSDPARVFKTLVTRVDGTLTVAVVPVSGQLDLKALAHAAGGRKAVMAEPADAERTTGYMRGGISPLGQRKALPTVVDDSALRFGTVLVSGGRRGLQVELPPADLVRLCRARRRPS
jgi:Cys-tRNA(Pro)/Cys-tRNA(Cys) deacylase